jgi:hypothetical protein
MALARGKACDWENKRGSGLRWQTNGAVGGPRGVSKAEALLREPELKQAKDSLPDLIQELKTVATPLSGTAGDPNRNVDGRSH